MNLENNSLFDWHGLYKNFPFLKVLILDKNKLMTIFKDFEIYYGHWKQLKILSLNDCGIEKIGEEIVHLSSLEELYLSSNQIAEFPNVMESLRKLSILILDKNKLKKLPKSIEYLICLKKLSVNYNSIRVFQEEICKLSELK